MSTWKAQAAATLVGSMPHTDRRKAIELVLSEMLEIPLWPQLPVYTPEQMMIQYLEGLPGLRPKGNGFFIQSDSQTFDDELYAFYEEYLAVESGAVPLKNSRFAFGRETGMTFFAFLSAMEQSGLKPRAIKGQVVGPFTLLSDLKDQNNRSILYDDRLCDVVVKHLTMKACWQIEHLKAFQTPVIIFLDEPALAGFGSSAFISISRDRIDQILAEIVESLQDAGAMVGIHVCANTDWLIALQSSMDIINFDAFNFFDKFAMYREPFQEYLARGKTVAWGMVPTQDAETLEKQTPRGLADLWLQRVEALTTESLTVQEILKQSLFTPSCGCAGLPIEAAERVVAQTRALAEIMQDAI